MEEKGHTNVDQIVDQCATCEANQIDLYPNAFAVLADKSAGVIDVDWQIVPCGIDSAAQVHVKSGSDQYWYVIENQVILILTVNLSGSP